MSTQPDSETERTRAKLIRAIRGGELCAVRHLITTNSWLVHVKNPKNGETPLLFATSVGNAEAAKLLVLEGADVNVHLKDGLSPLLGAADHGMTEVVKLLLARGADPARRHSFTGETPLSCAVAKGHREIVDVLQAATASEPSLRKQRERLERKQDEPLRKDRREQWEREQRDLIIRTQAPCVRCGKISSTLETICPYCGRTKWRKRLKIMAIAACLATIGLLLFTSQGWLWLFIAIGVLGTAPLLFLIICRLTWAPISSKWRCHQCAAKNDSVQVCHNCGVPGDFREKQRPVSDSGNSPFRRG